MIVKEECCHIVFAKITVVIEGGLEIGASGHALTPAEGKIIAPRIGAYYVICAIPVEHVTAFPNSGVRIRQAGIP